MKITLEEMRETAKTLPVGYYLGRKVPVMIEPSGGAFCDVMKGEIHIGLDLLQQAADMIDPADAEKWSREAMLRCVLYHEVGHVLLSPEWLGFRVHLVDPRESEYFDDKTNHDLINIFEDERLEQLFSQFFIGVDFKGFIKLVSKKSGGSGSTTSKVFDAVRLRRTTAGISAMVDDAIQSLSGINCTTVAYDGEPANYATKLNNLLKEILTQKKEEQDEKSEDSGKNQQEKGDGNSDGSPQDKQEEESGDGDGGNPEGENSSENEDGADGTPNSEDKSGDSEDDSDGDAKGDAKENADGDEPDDGDSNSGDSGDDDPDEENSDEEEDEGEDGENSEGCEADKDADESQEQGEDDKSKPTNAQTPRTLKLPKNFMTSLAGEVFVTPTPDVTRTLDRLATRIAKQKGTQSAGRWSALHGRIDARRDAQDKERIFRRRSDVGERLMSSVNLTLWVDVSGSFRASKDELNKILAATAKAVKMSGGKLVVNVVKMDDYAHVASEHDWMVNPSGDNDINSTYEEAWRKTRKRDRRNIDIVVFDGLCCFAARRLQGGESEAQIRSLHRTCGIQLDIAARIWNSPDCWIVSDTDNKKMFDVAAPKAHGTYMHTGYAEQLKQKVTEILDRIL